MRKALRILVIVIFLVLVATIGFMILEDQNKPHEAEGEYTQEDIAGVAQMVMPEESGSAEWMENFNTLDLYGNETGNEMFADYELTMVYVWGTYCNPCIKSMPVIQDVHEKFEGKGVNVIGIVVDVQDMEQKPIPEQVLLAREIGDYTGADFTNILISGNYLDPVMLQITVTPTTFFVDSQGSLVGELVQGGKSLEGWSEIIEQYL